MQENPAKSDGGATETDLDFLQGITIGEDRRRAELDGLLSMAEELQEGLETASQRFLTNSLLVGFAVIVGLATIIVLTFTVTAFQWKVVAGLLALPLVLLLTFVQSRSQTRFRLRQRRDRNSLNEVMSILQEIEPLIRTTSEWSRLDEAAFRIRLSRLSVGRTENTARTPVARDMANFTRTMRFLLEGSNAHYRQLVERLFHNIDVAVKNLMDAKDFDEVISRAGVRLEVLPDDVDFQRVVQEGRMRTNPTSAGTSSPQVHAAWAQWGGIQNYAIFTDGHIAMTRGSKRDFDARQEQLRIQLGSPIS